MAQLQPLVDLDTGSDEDRGTDFASTAKNQQLKNDDLEEDEDDYMNMAFDDASAKTAQPETSLQRRQRLKREAENRSRPKSKAEIAAQEAANRETGLATSLDESNKGFRMMAKLGFKPGAALGKEGGDARTEPVAVELKADRRGIGADADRKRKIRELAEEKEGEVKRRKEDEGDYRERMRVERENTRMEGQIIGAMKVCEGLEEGNGVANDGGGERVHEDAESAGDVEAPPTRRKASRPLQGIPLIYRTLVRHRLEKDREKRMRQDLNNSIGRGLPTYNDSDEDKDYRKAFAQEEVELEEDDPELEGFNTLEPSERLGRLVAYLRENHRYCFWCKAQYPDRDMEGCPGLTEEEHD